MKFIIRSLDARNADAPFYREVKGRWSPEKDYFIADAGKATQFVSESWAERWASNVLFLDKFKIEPAL